MIGGERTVATVADLVAVVEQAQVRRIVVAADLSGVPTLRLSPGQALVGTGQAHIRFVPGQDGIQLSADNEVGKLQLTADAERAALFNDTAITGLGRMYLHNLAITGTVRLLARERVQGGHIEASNIDIAAADARGSDERPRGYGVEVIPGAFTLWNQQTDPAVTISANLLVLSTGRPGARQRHLHRRGGRTGRSADRAPARNRFRLQ